MSDLHARLSRLLEDNRHKPPRVQARLALELIEQPAAPAPVPVVEDRPDPKPWKDFYRRLQHDPVGAMVDQGVATTRNRTHAAIAALGLDPVEVRALVVEHDAIRVYRWSDRDLAQTLPILEEKTA